MKESVEGVDGVPTTVVPSAIPVTLRVSVLHIERASFRQDYDNGCGKSGDPSAPELACSKERVDLDAVFDEDELWLKAELQRATRRRRC